MMELRDRIKKHWKMYRPDFYANLFDRGVLDTAVTRAIHLAQLDIEELVQTGMERGDAEEIIYSEFILAIPEPSQTETEHWFVQTLSDSRSSFAMN